LQPHQYLKMVSKRNMAITMDKSELKPMGPSLICTGWNALQIVDRYTDFFVFKPYSRIIARNTLRFLFLTNHGPTILSHISLEVSRLYRRQCADENG
jgi:hypothetical protein